MTSIARKPRGIAVWSIACASFAVALPGVPLQALAESRDSSREIDTAASLERLEVVVVQAGCDAAVLEAKIQSWFAGTPVRVGARHEMGLSSGVMLSPGKAAGIRVWLLARGAATVWLYFVLQPNADGPPRYLVRDLELERGLDELGVEQVAQVIYMSSVALWAGQVQSTRQQFEDRLSLASDAVLDQTRSLRDGRLDATPKAWTLSSGVAYALRLQGREGVSQGPIGTARLVRSVSGTDWGGRVAAQMLLPHQASAGPVSLDLRGYSLRASYTWNSRERDGLVLTNEIGPGVDLVRYSVSSPVAPGIQSLPAAWDTRPMIWLALGIEKRAARFQMGLQTTLAVQVVKTHYNLVSGNQHLVVLSPWMIQPGLVAYLMLAD